MTSPCPRPTRPGPDRAALERDGLGGPTSADWARLERAYAFQDLVAAELARPPAHDLWLAAILGALAAVVVVLRIFWVL